MSWGAYYEVVLVRNFVVERAHTEAVAGGARGRRRDLVELDRPRRGDCHRALRGDGGARRGRALCRLRDTVHNPDSESTRQRRDEPTYTQRS